MIIVKKNLLKKDALGIDCMTGSKIELELSILKKQCIESGIHELYACTALTSANLPTLGFVLDTKCFDGYNDLYRISF